MGKVNFRAFLPRLAGAAGKVLLEHYGKTHRVEWKPGAGIVTEADKRAEGVLLKKIFRKFPKSSIITEESGEYRGEGSLCWVLDPLDGTSNYAHGFPMFCVSIGLYEDGEAKAAVIYSPVLKEMFYAERGRGAYLNGRPIRVSKTKTVKEALLGTGFYYSTGAILRQEMKIFFRMNEAALAVRRPGSAALDLAFVACGRYDGFWERGLSPWDVAAGFLIVKEAGGMFTDYRGKKTDMFGKEVVASNGRIHKPLVSLMRA